MPNPLPQTLFIVAILGCFFLALFAMRTLLWPTIRPLFSSTGTVVHGALILVSTSWFLGMGLRGIVGMWGFYLDVPISEVAIAVGLLGIAGWFLSFFWLRTGVARRFLRRLSMQSIPRLNHWELIILAILALQILTYSYMAITPWRDWDEIELYGNFSKYVANGWVSGDYLKNEFYVIGDSFAEITAAQEIYSVKATYVARGLRVVNLVFISVGIYGLLRWLNANRSWSLLSIAGFLAVPDLVLFGTSLKVDGVTMVLELSAFMLLSVALVSLLPEHREKIHCRSYLLITAVFLSSVAFASRLSGLYFAAFVTLAALVVIFWERGSVRSKALLLLALFGAWALSSIGYFVNILELGNPIWPFVPPWPFEDGVGSRTFEGWKGQYNILGFPPLVQQLYLLFHISLGIEYWYWISDFSFIPHAEVPTGSILWLSPAILSIFLVPFYFKNSRVLVILEVVFIYWFMTWSLGLHFTRVFMAGGTVPILIAAIIASLDAANLSKAQRYLRKSVQGGLILIVLVFLPAQIREAYDNYPGLSALAGVEARYNSNVEVLQSTFLPLAHVRTELPTREEAEAISDALGRHPKALVHTETTSAMHILFENGFFINVVVPRDAGRGPAFHDGAACILLNQDSRFNDKQREVARLAFPNEEFATPTRSWELRCKRDR